MNPGKPSIVGVELYVAIINLCKLRDDAQNKMLGLKEKAEKEMTQFNVELKELIRVIDHDRKLREFMSCKDKERTDAHEQMELMRRRKEAEKSSDRDNTVMVSTFPINSEIGSATDLSLRLQAFQPDRTFVRSIV